MIEPCPKCGLCNDWHRRGCPLAGASGRIHPDAEPYQAGPWPLADTLLGTVIVAVVVVGLILALSGCARPEPPIERAERHLRQISAVGTPGEVCEAHRQLAAVMLDHGSDFDYRLAHGQAIEACRFL